ncbi:hybrid sensor histidine kinase/response regulator [Roseivirga seohaensis]|uniref:hybrid sensor histidine kinase/response regulator n=1 Tax=Roseivirga seohaensis TaxID=1914963 RepID=UPI00069D1F9B|nr:hybrid sensor histidine kinase/response regulator [Roseivirga seohaensis]
MTSQPIRILLVDDDEDDFVLTKDILDEIERFPYQLTWEPSYSKAISKINENAFDICLIDFRLGENDGISIISNAVKNEIQFPFILLTGKGDKEIDLRAMNEGAADYLVKGEITPQLMERSIRYALNHNKAIKQVKEGERKFRQLFERSIDAIYICDCNHNLLEANPSLEKLLGYKSEEISGMNMKDLFLHPADFERFTRLLSSKSQIKSLEAVFLAKDNRKLICQLNAVVRTDFSKNSIGFQGILRDITLLKKAERDLLMAEKLSVTGKIARSVAHEVRNPLTNIQLAISQMRDEVTEDDSEMAFMIDMVDRNAGRINQLITEMLNSSKPKSLQKEELSMNELINESIELVKDRFILKGMKLVQNLDPELESLLVDKEQIKVVMINLMINALEAMEENKGVLHVSTLDLDDSIEISVTDNGSGISKEDVKKLFDLFYTKKSGGMGLGLTSTLTIVQSHGGSIDVSSKLNEGTTFTVSLPKDSPASIENLEDE